MKTEPHKLCGANPAAVIWDGADRIPTHGTYLLEKGERIATPPARKTGKSAMWIELVKRVQDWRRRQAYGNRLAAERYRLATRWNGQQGPNDVDGMQNMRAARLRHLDKLQRYSRRQKGWRV